MNNDLISRSALKKAIEGLVVGGAEGLKNYYENGSKSDENAWIGGIYDAWELIDNAPTVEANSIIDGLNNEINDLLKNLVWYMNERDKLLKERKPQGEWEEPFEHNGKMYHKCNQCHISSPFMLIDNYCSYCGADMRGNKE